MLVEQGDFDGCEQLIGEAAEGKLYIDRTLCYR